MYEWIPKKRNQTARNMIFLLFGGAAVLLLVTMAVPGVPFRWAFQLIALGLLTASLFLVTRYLTKCFVYRIIEDGEGGYDLTVTETATNGKRAVTVCRVGMRNVLSVVRLDLSDGGASLAKWKEIKKKRGRIFDYCADFRPTVSVLVTVREGGEDLMIRLSPEDELTALLERAARSEEEQ